jgi:hypothetical protein
VLVMWTMVDVPHQCIFTMDAPEFREREKRDLGPARRRRRIPKRPTSLGQLLAKSKWEKPRADWIVATRVGLLGPGKQDYEDQQIERNDGWRREPFV